MQSLALHFVRANFDYINISSYTKKNKQKYLRHNHPYTSDQFELNHGVFYSQVTWIRRKKDHQLLTVGLTTYASDERFQARHFQHSEDWTLEIKYVQSRDAGTYECQVSTHPPASIFLFLEVVGEYIYTLDLLRISLRATGRVCVFDSGLARFGSRL